MRALAHGLMTARTIARVHAGLVRQVAEGTVAACSSVRRPDVEGDVAPAGVAPSRRAAGLGGRGLLLAVRVVAHAAVATMRIAAWIHVHPRQALAHFVAGEALPFPRHQRARRGVAGRQSRYLGRETMA